MEANMKNAEYIMVIVQNTQRMEMEDNKKKAEDDLRKQQVELASTKSSKKVNKKQWQRVCAGFQNQLEEKLKEVSKDTHHSMRCFSKSVADDKKLKDPEGNTK
jgi:hypothetical protein